MLYGTRLRALSIATLVTLTAALRARASSTRPWTPTRASCRRSSTCTCRSAIVALCGFVSGGIYGDPAPAHARPAVRPALLRRDPPEPRARRGRAHHGLDLGARRAGATGGCGTSRRSSRSSSCSCSTRPTSRCASSIEDREKQARYASVFAVDGGRVRAAELHRRAPRAGATRTRACSRPPTAACRAKMRCRSTSRCSAWRCST